MSAHEDIYVAGDKVIENLLAFFSFDSACEEFYADVHVAKKTAYGFDMLFGKDFRRSHDACLASVVECEE